LHNREFRSQQIKEKRISIKQTGTEHARLAAS
jgi:hypothetical protein